MKNSAMFAGVAAAAATAAIFGLAPAPAPATSPVAAASAAVAETVYKIDPVHSSIVFRIRHMGVAPFYGRFNGVEGDFALNPDNPGSGHVNITVNASTVDTNSDRRDDHLRSADFFNVNQFPDITFESTSIEDAGDGKLKVTGDLTLHGVKKPVTATVESRERETQRGKIAGLATEFTIKRSDHDMTYGIDQNSLGDEVTLLIALEGKPE